MEDIEEGYEDEVFEEISQQRFSENEYALVEEGTDHVEGDVTVENLTAEEVNEIVPEGDVDKNVIPELEASEVGEQQDLELKASQPELETAPASTVPAEGEISPEKGLEGKSFESIQTPGDTENEEVKDEVGRKSQEEEEEEEEKIPLLSPKDYSEIDPSFLDEFESSLEAVVKKEEVIVEEEVEIVEEEEVSSDEDNYAVYHLPSSARVDVYDQICEEKSIESTDSSFSDADLSARRKREPELPSSQASARLNELMYLKNLAQPELVQALAEVALYQPNRPLEYLSHFLARAGLSREELGMDPDPREIQELVDLHERELEREFRKRKSGLISGETSYVPSKSTSTTKSGPLQGVREKYHTDMAKIRSMTAEKQNERIRKGGKEYKKFECLGPTTLIKGYLPRNTFK